MGPRDVVRQAIADDAPAIGRLLHDFNVEFSEPAPAPEVVARHVRALLEAGELLVLLAGEAPEGLAVLRFRRSYWDGELEAYLQELYVVQPRRGRGLGRALLEAAMAAARDAGATHLELTTSEGDVAARALYESAGFTNREGSPDGPVMLYYERAL